MTVLSGNGQLICPACIYATFRNFLPMVVKVTDAAGKPIANKTVNWNITGYPPGVSPILTQTATTTDANGVTSSSIVQTSQTGSATLGFLQSTIQASADTISATFYETMALTDNSQTPFVLAKVLDPPQGTTLTGTAGGTSSSPVRIKIDAFGTPVPNISVRLINANDPTMGASASCVPSPGAGPGAVLTDASGNAACTPVFGSVTGSGNFTTLVGGVDGSTNPDGTAGITGTTTPIGYAQLYSIPITVTGATAGTISVSSGSNQSANPGQALPNPLVARVADSTGATPVSNVPVTWTVSPASAATVNPPTSNTDSQGLASTNVTLSSTASGQVTVKAALTGASSNISTTFTITVTVATVPVTSVTKQGGDGQTAVINTAFSQPLAVQVNTSAGVATNTPVTFSVSGPALIGGQTSSTVNTDSSGKAQINLTAGSTTGAVTVTASAGGQSTSFSETVVPVGPNLTPNSFYNAAGLKPGSLSPCGLAVIIASGLAPGVQGSLNPPSLFGAYPATLGPSTVSFNGIRAPILRVTNSGGQESVTVQVPCDVTPGSSVPVTVSASGGNASANVAIQPASPGIFETPMSDGVPRAVLVRPDGSFVSLENPARRGEVINVYVTGLGTTIPAVGTNSIPIPSGSSALVQGQVIVGVNNSGSRVISARLSPTQIGIYEVAFQVDANAPTGNNVVLSVAVNPTDGSATQFSNGSKIPIQ